MFIPDWNIFVAVRPIFKIVPGELAPINDSMSNVSQELIISDDVRLWFHLHLLTKTTPHTPGFRTEVYMADTRYYTGVPLNKQIVPHVNTNSDLHYS